MIKRRILIAGGSGFLGAALSEYLRERHFDVTILTRKEATAPGMVRWDSSQVGPWYQHLDGAAALINLCGRNMDCRPTRSNRMDIVRSRVQSIVTLANAIRECETPPECWIQASSLAVYGDSSDQVCTEATRPGVGPSVDLCKRWEKEFQMQHLEGVRKVVVRIGVVIGAQSDALQRLARLTQMGLGSRVGSGKQGISWIHQHDWHRVVQWCLDNHLAHGVYNATGPTPVSNAEFMAALRAVLQRSAWLPTPGFMARLGAWLMRTDPALVLTGRRCLPQRLMDLGFTFEFPELTEALQNLFANQSASHR
jgi:uncharacterized protein